MNRNTTAGGTTIDRDKYMDLVRRFPPRPIRSKAAYSQANRIYQELLIRDADLDQDEADYAHLLGRMIRDYDEQHHAELLKEKATPIEMLKFLMQERGMKTTDLGELVGGRGQASLILSGKRELSKANLRALGDHFHVSPAVFL